MFSTCFFLFFSYPAVFNKLRSKTSVNIHVQTRTSRPTQVLAGKCLSGKALAAVALQKPAASALPLTF